MASNLGRPGERVVWNFRAVLGGSTFVNIHAFCGLTGYY